MTTRSSSRSSRPIWRIEPLGNVGWTADRPAASRPVGQEPPTELERGDELGRLRDADARHRGQLQLGRRASPARPSCAASASAARSTADRPRVPDPQRSPMSSAEVRPPTPRSASRSRGRSASGTSRMARPAGGGKSSIRANGATVASTDGSGRSGAPGPGRREPADSPRRPDHEDDAEPTGAPSPEAQPAVHHGSPGRDAPCRAPPTRVRSSGWRPGR